MNDIKKAIVQWLEGEEAFFTDIAKQIWDQPQIAYEEAFAADLQMNTLAKHGFRISPNIADIPTAFYAEYGNGHPIIGILGEFDALPGLSQKVSTTYDPVQPNGPGHGCGHNLLGTAGVAAVIAIKKQIEAGTISGTIRYYGCPAEEVLSGKTFMARAGAFDDLACALTWHPWMYNGVMYMSTQAMASINFNFKGIAAHAAGAPHTGRSALDAVELMNVGANYLREHVPDGSRIHYVITNGGLAPNIVPDEASVWYYARAASKSAVDDLIRRIRQVADGAALMTETSVTSSILANTYEYLPNDTINKALFENMEALGAPSFTKEEHDFAAQLLDTVDSKTIESAKTMFGKRLNKPLPTDNIDTTDHTGVTMPGSSDVADVSWITPTAWVTTTCAPVGVLNHSWQATAAFGSTLGMKGMHYAAKTMAVTAYDLLSDQDLLKNAQREFKNQTKDQPYTCGIPDEIKPPAHQHTPPVTAI
ncbi:amidohydrolase [Bacillaceae bacterium SIJ1]|uniref:amidohydrolase n=1 Tax=Litoribacterium kuwaitense TaxID=1398745 RepID=UPI0013EB261A|nr:amidohydrolase [Litoribacterium kuwaitense]NGP45928.1 amidohydrolase [Litoribacterium kuwaitense]